MVNLRYFKPVEFEKATPACSIDDMDEEFLLKLDEARTLAGVPFIISSAFRSEEYEHSKGRHLDNVGAHSRKPCKAVDILCFTSRDRLKMVTALLCVGFKRIGIYRDFVHVDRDVTKPSCLWLG